MADLVRLAAAVHGRKPALIDGARSLTWSELDARATAAGADLLRRGLRPGERVALVLGTSLEFAVSYFGVLRAGLVAVPTSPAQTAREIAHVLGDAQVAAVVAEPGLASVAQVLAEAGPDGPLLLPPSDLSASSDLSDPSGPSDLNDPSVTSEVGAPSGEALAVVLYTSGTSGRPRGAMLTHRALLADLDNVSRIEPAPTRADDVVLLALPLFHVFGLNTGLGMVARAGATGVLVDRFDAPIVADLLRRHGVTNLLGVPPMFRELAALPSATEAFARVRIAVSGAAPLPRDVAEAFRSASGVRLHEGYGLTETAPSVTSTLCSPTASVGSIGRSVPGVEVELVDATGEPVDPDDPGEIRVRGANLFSGYWPDGREGPDERGWWGTGDVAVADASGDLTLVDRRRELILVSGFNVYPREVEAVLARFPEAAEVAVLGVPHPATGEAVKAFVVPRPGTTPTADAVLVHAAGQLARFKCPTVIEFVEALPHTLIGKVARGQLRQPGQQG